MDVKELYEARREVLRAFIKAYFNETANQFATEIDETQSFISGLLSGEKPFGERLALRLEEAIRAKGHFPIRLLSPETGPMPTALEAEAYNRERDLLDAFRRLAPARQIELLAQIALEAMRARSQPLDPQHKKVASSF